MEKHPVISTRRFLSNYPFLPPILMLEMTSPGNLLYILRLDVCSTHVAVYPLLS